MTSKSRPRSKLLDRIALSVLATLSALGIAELGCRILDLPNEAVDRFGFLGPELGKAGLYVPHTTLFWRLDPSNTEYRTNALGLRGPWFEDLRPAREFRIVAVGDSCTFGAGVRYEQSWPIQLERLVQFDLRTRPVRSVIAALPGWSTYQNLALLESELPELRADLTVFYCGVWNDYIAAIEMPDHLRAARLRGESRGIRLARIARDFMRGSRDDYERAFAAGTLPDGRRVPLSQFRQNLARMFDLATARDGARAIAVVPVLPAHMHKRFPIAAQYHAAVVETAKARGVPVVDPRESFDTFHAACPKGFRNPLGQPWCFVDSIHPSKIGHRLIAEAVHAALESEPESAQPAQLTLSPAEVLACTDAKISLLPNMGDALQGPLTRLFVGPHVVDGPALGADGTVRFELPIHCPPGSHDVAIVDANGLQICPIPLRVSAPPLVAGFETTSATQSRFRFEFHTRPGWDVLVWFGEAEREPATPTDYGPFSLTVGAGPDGRPKGREDLPFSYERLELPHVAGKADDSGVAVILTPEFPTPKSGRSTWVQAIARDPLSGIGIVSTPQQLIAR